MAFSVAPLITVERSPVGRLRGKSTPASTRTVKRYHPRKDIASSIPAPACWSWVPKTVFPFESWKNAPDRQENVGRSMSKIENRIMFVRRAAIVKTVLRRTMARRKNAKVAKNSGAARPSCGAVIGLDEYAA